MRLGLAIDYLYLYVKLAEIHHLLIVVEYDQSHGIDRALVELYVLLVSHPPYRARASGSSGYPGGITEGVYGLHDDIYWLREGKYTQRTHHASYRDTEDPAGRH